MTQEWDKSKIEKILALFNMLKVFCEKISKPHKIYAGKFCESHGVNNMALKFAVKLGMFKSLGSGKWHSNLAKKPWDNTLMGYAEGIYISQLTYKKSINERAINKRKQKEKLKLQRVSPIETFNKMLPESTIIPKTSLEKLLQELIGKFSKGITVEINIKLNK